MPHNTIPLALYVGPALVLAAVNHVWRSLYPGDPPIGVPAREAFTGDAWTRVIEAMERTLATGIEGHAPCSHDPEGLIILRLPDEPGRPPAVVTACSLSRLAPIPPRLDEPTLRASMSDLQRT